MASMEFGDAFDTLADDEFWMDAAMVFIGFIFPIVLANVIEGMADMDLPNELYGIGVAGAASVGDYRMVSVGGGLYTVDALAQRGEVKQRVSNLSGSVGGN
jgi:hypothetical protein